MLPDGAVARTRSDRLLTVPPLTVPPGTTTTGCDGGAGGVVSMVKSTVTSGVVWVKRSAAGRPPGRAPAVSGRPARVATSLSVSDTPRAGLPRLSRLTGAEPSSDRVSSDTPLGSLAATTSWAVGLKAVGVTSEALPAGTTLAT